MNAKFFDTRSDVEDRHSFSENEFAAITIIQFIVSSVKVDNPGNVWKFEGR